MRSLWVGCFGQAAGEVVGKVLWVGLLVRLALAGGYITVGEV